MNMEGDCRELDCVFFSELVTAVEMHLHHNIDLLSAVQCSLFVQPCTYSVKALLGGFPGTFTSNYLHTICETTESAAVQHI